MKQRIIAVVNQKGGVGKTTSAVNLAAGLALTGRRVLLVDMDPQGNASTHLNCEPVSDEQKTTYELLIDEVSYKDVLVHAKDNLDVLPADIRLADAEPELVGAMGKDVRLKSALSDATDYHYILIDCPPSLGQLTLNALTAAGELIVVVEAEAFAYKAISHLLKTVDKIRKFCNAELEVSGMICTKFLGALNLSRDIQDLVEKNFGEILFKTNIRKNVKIAEAAAFKQDVFEYDATCSGALDYAALCKEIIAKEGE